MFKSEIRTSIFPKSYLFLMSMAKHLGTRNEKD